MAAALARGLEAEGFVVDIAGDGPSGLEAARFGGYDAVLLDVMLPGESGYTVVKTLRAEQNWVPVLMLTAKDGEYDEADGLDYGADDYLTKPFSFVVLLARLRALLRREAGPRPTALTVGPVTLDPAAHRVTLDGAEVSAVPPRVPRARAPAAGPPGRRQQGVHPRCRVGHAGRDGREHRRGLHRLPAPQARPRPDRDRPGRGLPDGTVRPFWSRLSLRSRLMVVGLAGVAVALLLGGLLLYAAMVTTLDRSVQSEARASAKEVATLVDAGRLPDPLPVSGAQVVQVIDSQHRVVGGSATADRLTPLVSPAELKRLTAGGSITVPGHRTGLSGALEVAAVEAGPSAERVAVVAAVPTADLETSRRVLRTLLLVFFPLFLAALGVIAWRVIGSALRPVEALRHGAERIGQGTPDDERLPVPPTGDEVAALATTLNGMLDRLAAAQTKQRSFVADAAHELRSPLASMRTQLEVAARVGETGGLPAGLLPEVQRLSGLVEDLLVLARAGDDGGPRRVEDVDAADLLAEVADRYAAARVPVRARHPSEEDGDTLQVRASRSDLLRAVGNLVDNAVRHATTQVSLSARATAGVSS